MIDTLPRSTIAPLRRRTPESPTLWVLLLAGSLLLHLVLLLLLRPWEAVTAGGGQGGDGSVAIELADVGSETGQTSLAGASPQSGTIAPTAIATAPIPEDNQDIQAPPRSPDKPAPRSPQTLVPPPPTTPPPATPPPTATPLRGQQEMQPPEKVVASTPPPAPAPAPPPPPPPVPVPTPSALPQPPSGPTQSGQKLPAPLPMSQQLEDLGTPSQPAAGVPISAPVTPVTPVNQELRLTIVQLRTVNRKDPVTPGSDFPDRFAQVVGSSASSPAPPCIRGSVGQSPALALWLPLTLDTNGVPKAVATNPSSACDVAKFAADLVRREIRFLPAQKAGKAVDSEIEVQVRLSLV